MRCYMKDIKLIWIYPDRCTHEQNQKEFSHVWDIYADVAKDLNVTLSVVSPDEIDFGSDRKTYVKGQLVSPNNTIFVTSMWTLPYQQQDVTNMIFIYKNLEQLDFYLPIPPETSIMTTDKYATNQFFHKFGLPILPTSRINANRNFTQSNYLSALPKEVPFPWIVKPAYWGMGLGVSKVNSLEEFHSLLGLASASGNALIVQQCGGEACDDYRVYIVDKRIIGVLRRRPQKGSVTANLSTGGKMDFVELPQELEDYVATIIEHLNIPYFGADFLHTEQGFVLSEIEPDAAIGFPNNESASTLHRKMIATRILSYLHHHEFWISSKNLI
jgi:glutathione synthase/RimK-type ligase-like ATP-grasp enzyme